MCISNMRDKLSASVGTVHITGPLEKNILKLITLSGEKNLVSGSCCDNTGSIRDDPYWACRKNSLERIKLSSINNVFKFPSS